MSSTLYSSFAALLFLLCAAVQTNDPDPAFWIATYLIGGPGLALLPRFIDHVAFARFLAIWLAALFVLAANLAAGLRLRMQDTAGVADANDSLLWQLLEHELGRELGGTVALIIHAIILRILINNNNNNNNKSKAQGSSIVATLALSLGAALLIAMAFTWFQFQPAMIARYQSEAPHCSGALSQQ